MDFIKKLISGILGFVTGILGFVTGLLPSKKQSNGYFLELDEATSQSKPAASNGKAATPAISPAAKSPEPQTAKATTTATKTKVEASQNGKAVKAEPAKAAATASPKTPAETTFAPKYLAPSTTSSNGRRRPGANMSAYLDMARQVKTPNTSNN
ncbi:hypothetical protein GNF10_01940 [Nostoc sp. UCD121]|uniref:hypothetical protein n=1 Tax=unclassified Nostoc TaxID=2593658 RepID=UPI0016269672|nr:MULTISPECIES: hypothetical protein [unclassified Nostoc]MBC1222725.1 hypothetical protein [Nostoc sp. UCD120]MBC1274774.1 hypothetical protein [Nostoc sp. UCD121]MBC1296059.1 hypothetical protein [Nostoc sp. UCD122]